VIAMPQQNHIKELYEREGKSISEISRIVGVSWRVAKKYALKEDWNEPAEIKPKKSIMDPYVDIIDIWLLEDSLRPRKERRPAIKIYRDLRDDYGYQGSERAARGFVAERKKALVDNEKFLEIEHHPGTAQADFGTTGVIIDGVIQKALVLNLSFPHSNAGFFYPLPAENQECFFHGLSEIFGYIGGVPKEILFDNLTAAVVMRGGTRKLTDDFLRFKNHHRFKANFCAPAKGNEKGNVENKVGYSRRNFIIPYPVIEGFEDLAKLLFDKAWSDLDRLHYRKEVPIKELWGEDKEGLLPLPATPFMHEKLSVARVNKYCQIRFNNELYSLPCADVGQKVVVKSTWNELKFYNHDGEHLNTLPRKYTGKTEPIDWISIFKIFVQKPRGAKEATMFKFLPEAVRSYLCSCLQDRFRDALKLLLTLLQEKFQIEDIAQAIEDLDGNAYNESLLRHALYKHTAEPDLATLDDNYTPDILKNYNPQLEHYNRLLYSGGGENNDLHPETM
jgi:transposase